MNKSILIGRLTRDVELKYSQDGNIAIARFNLAVRRDFKNKQTGEYESDFPSCVAFGKTAELIETYFKKGSRIGIDGKIQTRTWDDNNGKKHYVTEVAVTNIEFIDYKKTDSNASGQASDDGFFPVESDDELPF